MKVINARVQWYKGYSNNPTMEVLVDHIPDDLVYEEKDGLYYAESEGFVSFFYYKRPGDGYGGSVFKIKMWDGSDRSLKGPWSSRAGCANRLGFGPCADISITADPKVFEKGYTFYGAACTINILKDAAKIAGVHLVKVVDKNDWTANDLDCHQRHASFGNSDFVFSFETEIPEGIEWIAIPSLDPIKLVKEQ